MSSRGFVSFPKSVLALATAAVLLASLASTGTANAEDLPFLFKFNVTGSSYPIGIATDSADFVYVVYDAFAAVQKYSSTGTLIDTWNTGFGRQDDIVIDKDDNVYVSERPAHRVVKFDTDGDVIGWLGKCTGGANCDTENERSNGFSCTDETCTGLGAGSGDGQFEHTRGMAVDADGNLYVADQFNHRIQVFDSDGNFLFKFGEEGTGDGQLTYVEGIRLDSSGNIYVSDMNDVGTRIQKFTGDGEFIGWLGKCTGGSNCDIEHERSNGFSCTETTCTGFGAGIGDGQLDGNDAVSGYAPGLLIDPDDNLYVAEYGNTRVQKFNDDGEFVGWAGKCTGGSNCDTENQRSMGFSCTEETCTGLEAGQGDGQFLRPTRMAQNSFGNIYVLDARDQYDFLGFDPDNVVHVYGTSAAVNLTVNAVDLGNNPLNGVWATVRTMDGTLLKSGFTPLVFTGNSGAPYRVSVADYDGRTFKHWEDDGMTRARTLTMTSDITITASFDIGDSIRGFTSLTYTGTEEQPDLTVNAVTFDGSNLRMWTIIDPQSSDESGTTYKVYASNYKNRVFDHWDDGSKSRIRTLTITEDTTITASYAGPEGALAEKTFGSDENEGVADVATHPSGVYVAGTTAGTLPGQTSSGDSDAFIKKFDHSGNEIWTSQFGTSESDGASGLAVSDSGIYVIGSGIGIQKFDHDGTHVWTTQIADATVDAIAADGSGVYVVGETGIELPGSTKVGPDDWDTGRLFLRKYEPATGDPLYTVQWGVGETLFGEEVSAVEIGALPTVSTVDVFSGAVYVGGQGWPDGSSSPHPGAADAHINKLDADDGSFLWSEFLGAPRASVAEVDAGPQEIFVAGTCCVAPGAAVGTGSGYLARYDEDGNQLFVEQFTVNEAPEWVTSGARGIAVNDSGVYVTGATGNVEGLSSLQFFLKKFDFDGNELSSTDVSLYPENVAADTSAVYLVGLTTETSPFLASEQLDVYLRIYTTS